MGDFEGASKQCAKLIRERTGVLRFVSEHKYECWKIEDDTFWSKALFQRSGAAVVDPPPPGIVAKIEEGNRRLIDPWREGLTDYPDEDSDDFWSSQVCRSGGLGADFSYNWKEKRRDAVLEALRKFDEIKGYELDIIRRGNTYFQPEPILDSEEWLSNTDEGHETWVQKYGNRFYQSRNTQGRHRLRDVNRTLNGQAPTDARLAKIGRTDEIDLSSSAGV